nr:MAG: hypothetical protein H1Bulk305_000008 [Cystoviridae sp.]
MTRYRFSTYPCFSARLFASLQKMEEQIRKDIAILLLKKQLRGALDKGADLGAIAVARNYLRWRLRNMKRNSYHKKGKNATG